MTEAYPLSWPAGVPRVKSPVSSAFAQQVRQAAPHLLLSRAQNTLLRQLELMGASQIVVTTNMGPRKNDGTLYANARLQGNDPGVAVYFTRKKVRHCIACDRYLASWENIHAVALTVEAMRGIERWGSVDMLDRAFQGFAALPAPTVVEAWWDVFGVTRLTAADVVEAKYRLLAKVAHPDAGGSHDAMSRLNQAIESFRAERGGL